MKPAAIVAVVAVVAWAIGAWAVLSYADDQGFAS